MKHPFRLPISVAVLALALAVAQPAMAKPEEKGQRRSGGHSSVRENRGSHSGKRVAVQRGERRSHREGDRVVSRGSGSRRDGSRSANRGNTRGGERRQYAGGPSRSPVRGNVRDGQRRRDDGERRQYAGGTPRGGTRNTIRRETRYRDRKPEIRAEGRTRDGGRVRDSRIHSRDRSYGGQQRPGYSTRYKSRHGGRGYSDYRPRQYYTSYFPRPRYVYRSGFSLGFVIGSSPSYGYGYYDPYCGTSFHDLGAYYDHCGHHRHTELILIVDSHGGGPIASCVYRSGGWVVDDCYDGSYDDGYGDRYDDGYDEGYDDCDDSF